MFQGGLTEPVIVHWLEKSGKRPAKVTSDDLVALHKAGASDDFLKRLVDLAGSAPPPPPPSPSTPPSAEGTRQPAPAPAAPAAPPAAPVVAPAAPAPAPTASWPAPVAPPPPPAFPDGTVKVRLAVTYRPVLLEEEEPWTLFIYVDGRFLVSVEALRVPMPLPPKRFDVQLPPGRHVLRLAEERHLKYSRVRGYLSPSRVDPDDFPFSLDADKAAEIEIRCGDTSIRHAGPVEMRVKENGNEVSQREPVRTDAETWPALCEDVDVALPAGARVTAVARHDREHCVHWADLWSGVPGVPSRAEVLAEIARHPKGGGGGAP
jgi:hypothetical protein